MATKTFKIAWMGQYTANPNRYYGGYTPIRVGGPENFHSYIGFPTAVRDALKTSKTPTTLKLWIYVYDASPEWDVGAHKETYNKASGTMPWYKYLRAFQGYGTGWISFDLTNIFMNDYKNGVYHGVVLYSGASSAYYGEAHGLRSDNLSAYIEVTGDWNNPPGKPTITYPQGGEVVDQSLTVRWNPATDPDGDSLTYQVAINDGTGWKYYSAGSGTSYTINTSSLKETSNAQVAVRAYDGQEYGAWAYSNYFVINHNRPPSAPTQLSPATGTVIDRTKVNRFLWKHNDDGPQAGFRIAWRVVNPDGTRGEWNYIPSPTSFMNTTNQYYDMPAYTFPFGTIEWGVQTKDQQGLESPYSQWQIITVSQSSNAPTILQPTNFGEVSTTRVTVVWSSLNQIQYDLALYDTDGNELYREVKSGPTKQVTIPVDLENNKYYEIHLRVLDSTAQLWSDYTVVVFYTNFAPPLPPVIKYFEEASDGVINIHYRAGEVDILPPFLVNGEPNPLLAPYSNSVPDTDYVILDERTIAITGGLKGVEFWLTNFHIPIQENAVYRLTATFDVQGGRMYIGAYDLDDNVLAYIDTAPNKDQAPVGPTTLEFTMPVGTAKVRVIFYTTQDNTGTVTISNVFLDMDAITPTEEIQIFRREYTPTGAAPWVMIAKGLPVVGSFLDYTPASGVLYEYKLRAVNHTNETSIDTEPQQISVTFEDTFLQEASDLSRIMLLKYATSREVKLGIEGELMRFVGRTYPVREFGEHEDLVISVEWIVDTYPEVVMFKEMLQRRGILLYRDRNGRRYWVTCDGLEVKDNDVYGFTLRADFHVTDYIEGLSDEEGEVI